MIDPRELRIGNILNVLSGERVLIPSYQVKIAEIGFLGCEVYRIEDHSAKTNWVLYDHQHLDPIPLTPEWLERFGITNSGFRIPFDKEFSIDMNQDGTYYVWDSKRWALKDMSVHQFQNLYYAMTGRELELKNKP